MRLLAGFLVLTIAFHSSAAAQSAAELLQRAIYAERTAGDVAAARRLYRDVIAVTAAGSELRTSAEQRLRALEAKGEVPKAVPSPGTPRAVATGTRADSPLATLEGNRYRHHGTDLSLMLPNGWRLRGTMPSSDNGDMAMFSTIAPSASISLWLIRESNDAAAIHQRLDASPRNKELARRGSYPEYRLRPDSIQRTIVNGHEAMVAIADYQIDGKAMSEYMTWIFSEQTHAFSFAHVATEDLEHFRPQFDSFIKSVSMP